MEASLVRFCSDASGAGRRPASPTFLFTDIEGSTVRWERYPAEMGLALARHDGVVRAAIGGRGGSIFKTAGDSFCAAFSDVDAAVAAAVEIQRGLSSLDFAAVDGLRVRIAVHTGPAEQRDDDYFGQAVNRVARLTALAHGGQILLSETARELLDEAKHPDVVFDDLGTHRLKDLSKPERVAMVSASGLARTFPPLRSVGALAHNLPLQLTSFVGREREVAEIAELVRRHRLVTLTGAGGIGKSRTSLYVAANFGDGTLGDVWLVELAALTEASQITLAIAASIGVTLRAGEDPKAALIAALGEQRMLLVLNNCEHLIDEVASVAFAILRGCPNVRVLASSRQQLSVYGECAYRIPSLSTPDAATARTLKAEDALAYASIALFVDRASEVGRPFELTDAVAPVVADICRRLDGIALAVELAAARARVLSPMQLRARLDERFRLLVGGSRTALPRQQTLRALIDWSYDLLGENERRALRELSVFPATFTLDAVEAVCDAEDARATIDVLAELVDKSLLTIEGRQDDDGAEGVRYRLLESIRDYASEKAVLARERDATQRRFLKWTTERMRQAHAAWETLSSERWQLAFENDLDNLRAAFGWALEQSGDIEGAQQLAAAARRFCGRIAPAEGVRWIRLAASFLDASSQPRLRAELSLAEAQVLVALRQHQSASEAAHRAIEEFAQVDDELGLAEAKNFAALALALFDGAAEAKRLLREAVDVFVRRGARQLSAYALHHLAFVYTSADETEPARAMFDEAIVNFALIGNERGVVAATVNLAELEFHDGHVEKAIALVDRAMALAGETPDLSTYLANKSAYCIALGRWNDAARTAAESLSVARRNGVGTDVATSLQRFAALAALRDGEFGKASLLLGYVDARLKALEGTRQFTERAEYERTLDVLRPALGESEFERQYRAGAHLREEEVLNLLPDALVR